MLGFIIWCVVGCMFFGFGVASFYSKRVVGFWAGGKIPAVTDMKAYNHAVGKLWCVFGIIFIFMGIPLLDGQNSPFVLLSVVGAMIWTIAMMVIYELGIMRKYRKE
ncbi:MAG: hypothetical protein J1E62_02610 [Lachnospiraceae bacterium]|nr:hypothetical protein [Lachnospiraceae bacterium]